jgi:hypothetical protein
MMVCKDLTAPGDSGGAGQLASHLRVIFFAALLLALSGSALNVVGQAQAEQRPVKKQPARKRHTLQITQSNIIGVSLKADKARMSEIAADLSKRLNARVMLGPSMVAEAITVEFVDLPFEPAMRLLAPHVYIDYEIRAGEQPKVLAVFLMGQDDPAPALNAAVQGSSQAILFEGNTEETAEQSADIGDEDPLQVDLDDDNLTIKSKKQPLAAVVITVADVLSVPAEIKYDGIELVDTVIRDTPIEEAIPKLSPNLRLYVRADVTLSKRMPLRLVLLPPLENAGQ